MSDYALKGHICYCNSSREVVVKENSYLICEEGRCAGVYEQLPDWYQGIPVVNYGDCLIIPGMVDLHTHAPQYTFRGLGMDRELMQWLETYTFPEEQRYADTAYAGRAYDIFAENIRRSATTRLCVFGTIHRPATIQLMDKLERSGVVSMVGKVNMDRNVPDYLCEGTTQSVDETIQWIDETIGRYQRTRPILTPRFVPTCTDALMQELGHIAQHYQLPVQSHLSENLSEIALVRELAPEAETYGHAYDRFGLFGSNGPCVMAHCVHSEESELELIRRRGVFIAHSPESNMNLSSGVAPVSRYLSMGLNVGLATDVAGGSSECMFRAMAHAVQASHLRWRLQDQDTPALSFADAFYMATRGGGAFFGKVGAFEPGYEMDALVIDDQEIETARTLQVSERLARLPYTTTYRQIRAKYVVGRKLWG